MGKKQHDEKLEFAEEMGIFFERTGFPRMAGRIWGWLLVCDPPEQSAAQIAEVLHASRGSVSTMTRLLVQIWGVERIGRPGTRGGFYRVKAGGFVQLLNTEMQIVSEIRRMSERGLRLLQNEPPALQERLKEGCDLFSFIEKEYPALIERWKQTRKKARK